MQIALGRHGNGSLGLRVRAWAWVAAGAVAGALVAPAHAGWMVRLACVAGGALAGALWVAAGTVRLTVAGWIFLGASVLVAATAINSGLPLLFAMFGCMLGALHVSAVLSRRMAIAVGVRRDCPARCRQGRAVAVGYVLRSGPRGGACLSVRVEESGRGAPELPPAHCGYVPARGEAFARTEMTPSRRGRIHLERLAVTTSFPFGLVFASRELRQEATLVVWPARGRLIGSLLQKGEALVASPSPSVRAGGQDEFYGLREYRLGDSARWIHWRRSAGRREPVIREMSRPRPRTLWVVLETHLPDSSAASIGRRERAIRLAGTLIEDSLAAGYRVGAALVSAGRCVVIAPADRRAQRHRLLDALAGVEDHTICHLPEMLGRLRQTWLRHAHVVIIDGSGSADALAEETLSRLRRHCRSLSIIGGDRVAEVFEDDPGVARAEGD